MYRKSISTLKVYTLCYLNKCTSSEVSFYILHSFFLITHGIIQLNLTEYNSIFHIKDYEASFLSDHPGY